TRRQFSTEHGRLGVSLRRHVGEYVVERAGSLHRPPAELVGWYHLGQRHELLPEHVDVLRLDLAPGLELGRVADGLSGEWGGGDETGQACHHGQGYQREPTR